MNPENETSARADCLLLLSWLGALRLGTPIRSDLLSLVPVYGGESAEPLAYRTLSEGLDAGEVTIAEYASASVPTLQLINHGNKSVLVLDGEEVVGGLQNRVVNTSLLIAAGTVFDLPVTCVEHGRWHAERTNFDAGEAVHPTLRRLKAEQVSASFARAAPPAADQAEVWAEVASRHRRTGTRSATAALRDAYVTRGRELEAAEQALVLPNDGPTGVIAMVEGRAVCADLFDRPETLRTYWSRLVRSYALEAVGSVPGEPRLDSAERLLARPADAALRPFKSPGLGVDVRVTGSGVVGASLVHARNVLHTALFRQTERLTRGQIRSPRERGRRFDR
jgi:hypothetical protein